MPSASGAALAVRKRALRSEMRRRRRALSGPFRLACGQAVARALAGAPELARAGRIGLYSALPDELPTAPLLDVLLGAGRVVLLPRIEGDSLVFVQARSRAALEPGRFGILEPTGPADAGPGASDVVLVPGLAFDRSGGRLGQGGGYYDRTFPPAVRDAPTLFGLAFACQIVDPVPVGPHDRLVDAIVTEDGILRVGGIR